MPQLYRNRRAVSIENDALRVTVLEGGGHIAEIFDKATGVNPLWTPVWPSIEPSAFDAGDASMRTGRRLTPASSPASWATTSASTSSAGRRQTKRPRA